MYACLLYCVCVCFDVLSLTGALMIAYRDVADPAELESAIAIVAGGRLNAGWLHDGFRTLSATDRAERRRCLLALKGPVARPKENRSAADQRVALLENVALVALFAALLLDAARREGASAARDLGELAAARLGFPGARSRPSCTRPRRPVPGCVRPLRYSRAMKRSDECYVPKERCHKHLDGAMGRAVRSPVQTSGIS